MPPRSRFADISQRQVWRIRVIACTRLRHTFATELLNAGMRLECLQVLLGHYSIEETRRYARLSDRTREEEYFKAMDIIEKGGTVELTDAILNCRRFLKRRNCAPNTVKNYLSLIRHFVIWVDVRWKR